MKGVIFYLGLDIRLFFQLETLSDFLLLWRKVSRSYEKKKLNKTLH